MKALITIAALSLCGAGHAEVQSSSDAGFEITHSVQLSASRQQVFSTLVEHIGRWWHPDHTYSGDASNLSLEAKAQGCFCERFDNGSVRHLTVVYAETGRLLRLRGGLGPLQALGVAGALSFQLHDADPGATQLSLTYHVGGNFGGQAEQWSKAVDQVLGQQLQRLRRLIENGNAEFEILPH